MVKVTKLTAENHGDVLAKMEDQAKRIYALEQAEKKKRRESMGQQLTRVLRDLTYFLKDATRAADERKKRISAATKAGLARAKKRGVKLGGARRTSKVDAKQVFALRKKGFTQQQIAVRLGISQPLVSNILANGRKS
jgi:hypothetical protein